MRTRCLWGQWWPRSVYTLSGSDQGLPCQLKESLDIVEYVDAGFSTNSLLAFFLLPKSCSGISELRDKDPDWCMNHQCKFNFIYFWLWCQTQRPLISNPEGKQCWCIWTAICLSWGYDSFQPKSVGIYLFGPHQADSRRVVSYWQNMWANLAVAKSRGGCISSVSSLSSVFLFLPCSSLSSPLLSLLSSPFLWETTQNDLQGLMCHLTRTQSIKNYIEDQACPGKSVRLTDQLNMTITVLTWL